MSDILDAINVDVFSFTVIDKAWHDEVVAEKDARIKELEVSLAGSRHDCRFQRWEKDRTSAFADLLEVENRGLRAEIAELARKPDASDEVKMIRTLRRALASTWTALEYDHGDLDQAIADAQTIADEGLRLSVKYCPPGKDLTDDTNGMEHWRLHHKAADSFIQPPGETI